MHRVNLLLHLNQYVMLLEILESYSGRVFEDLECAINAGGVGPLSQM